MVCCIKVDSLGKPKADTLLGIRSGDGKKVSQVRGPIVQEQHSLDRHIRVDDNPLTVFESLDVLLLDR